MAKEWYKKFLNSKRWKDCRKAYISERMLIDGGICEECHENLGYMVHHKILITQLNVNDPDTSLNHEHLMYVCKQCHDKYEGHGIGGRGKIRPLCMFDEQGQPISLREIDVKGAVGSSTR